MLSALFSKFAQSSSAWRIMPPARRQQALIQLLLQCASNFMEVMVLGLIVPLVAMVSNPAMIQRSQTLRRAYEFLGARSTSEFILYFGSGLLVLLVFRAVLSIWSTRRMRWLCIQFSTEMTQRVLDRILHLPYLEQARINSSVLARVTTSDVDRAAVQSLIIFFTMISESFTAATILLGLILVNPALMVPLILMLCLGAFFVYRRTRVKLSAAGETMRHEQAVVNKWVLQSLGDVRYARLAGSENFFVSKMGSAWHKYAIASLSVTTTQQSTRINFETAALGGVVLMVMYFVGFKSGDEMLAVLGMLAVATVRLIPSINRVINGAQVLDHIRASSDGVVAMLARAPAIRSTGTSNGTSFQQDLEFRNVTFSYPETKAPALSGVSLRIRRGEMVGVVGPSGAGKSTIIDILCGLIPPDSGEVTVDGRDVQADLRGWQSLIGYVPQTVFLLDDTIRANIAYGISEEQINDEAVRQALQTAALGDFVAGLPNGLNTNVGERGVALSGGQRQRIAIARALYRNAPILVLDEATSALDSATERDITETLRNIYGTKTIIVIAHRLNTVRESDRIYLMQNGHVEASGTFQELEKNSALFRSIGALA